MPQELAPGSSLQDPAAVALLPGRPSDARRAQNFQTLYRLGRELGRGQFGIVSEVTELATGKKFACKVLSKSKLKCASPRGEGKPRGGR